VVPWGVFALFRLAQTQRLLASGYTLDDIRRALREQVERRREELAYEFDRDPPLPARIIRWLSFGAVGAAVAAVAALVAWPAKDALFRVIFDWCAFGGVAGALVGRVYPGRRLPPSDPGLEQRSKLWSGRFGAFLARVVSIGLRRPALPPDTAHRPTEVAIGLAADALFGALPKETRAELSELPAVIHRLEADAQGLRARVDELNALMAGAGDDSVGAQSSSLRLAGADEVAIGSARRKLREDLATERDAVARRLATAVASLENIRLDLLRLTAGVGTVEQISADLTAARRIGADVDAVLEGKREVEALLAPPPRD